MAAGQTVREAIERVEVLSKLDGEGPDAGGETDPAAGRSQPRSGKARQNSARSGSEGTSALQLLVEAGWRRWLAHGEQGAGASGSRKASAAQSRSGSGSFWERLRPKTRAGGVTNRRVNPNLAKKLGRQGQEIYERSLLTLKLLSDRETGAIIAAPEFDRERESCGGYGYCWGRDGAFNAYAMGLAGMLEEAEAFFEFASRTQEPDGVWLHRHYASGELAPSWGLVQIDETGAIIWAAHEHFKMTGSREFLRGMWDSIRRGAAYLAGAIDEETGLPLPSFELWEEQLCESIYSAAAVAGGLRAAAGCARALGKDGEVRAWYGRAGQMREAIVRVLWDPKARSFLKSVKKSITEPEFNERVAAGDSDCYIELADGQAYPEYIQQQDHTTDSSLLGLAFPFRVLAPGDNMMKHAAVAVATRLWSPKAGGIMRYEGDHYVGGNPWILTTLWLAIYYLEAGETAKAVRLIRWAIDHSTESALLTEQVDKRTGKPIWAIPLGWSHAMYVIAALKLGGK
jgi:oligosaccharide amylase